MVCESPRQEGQRSSGLRPTLFRYELRAGENPDLSWERVVRRGRGRVCSSSEMGGAVSCRTLLGGREEMVLETAMVWRD